MKYTTGIIIGIIASQFIWLYRLYIKSTLQDGWNQIPVNYWFILLMCLIIGIGGTFMMNIMEHKPNSKSKYSGGTSYNSSKGG